MQRSTECFCYSDPHCTRFAKDGHDFQGRGRYVTSSSDALGCKIVQRQSPCFLGSPASCIDEYGVEVFQPGNRSATRRDLVGLFARLVDPGLICSSLLRHRCSVRFVFQLQPECSAAGWRFHPKRAGPGSLPEQSSGSCWHAVESRATHVSVMRRARSYSFLISS